MSDAQEKVSHPVRRVPGWVDYASLVALSLLFGISFTLTGIAVSELPPITVAAGRLSIAFLMLYPLMRLSGYRMPAPGPVWGLLFASAFFGYALPFAMISWGQVEVAAGLTAIFMAVMPLATITLAHLFTADEKLDRWKILGVLFGLAGVVILIGPGSLTSLGDQLLPQVVILGGAFSYAINAILTRRLVHLSRWSAVTALMLAASVLLLPASLALEHPWTFRPSFASLAAIGGLAVAPTAAATVLILVIVGRQGASFLSQINFMVPVFGMLFGVFLLGEQLPTTAYIALLVILSGITLSRIGQRIQSSTGRNKNQ